MAEVIVGPLVSLAIYLGTWINKKRKRRIINKENVSEATALVNAVNSLAGFVKEKVDAIHNYSSRNGFPYGSFGLS
jgi:hypothetical protein